VGKFLDLTGQKYNRLVAIKRVGREHSYAVWQCLCDCGNTTNVQSHRLTSGGVKSCGCLKHEKSLENLKQAQMVWLLPSGVAQIRQIIYGYKKQARNRNLGFYLNFFLGNCFYCNAIPSNLKTTVSGEFLYSGIDRVDNLKPYTPENCVSCCRMCNISKNNKSLDDFKIWIGQVYKHMKLEEQEKNESTS
jgi:hypothetical protein